jgi:microcystin degradation protein MlrC
MPTPLRVLLAGIFHETHTFVQGTTPLADFTIRRGDALLQRAGDGSMVDGFLEVAKSEGWDVVPVCDYLAAPSATMEHAAFETFWSELETGVKLALKDGPLDAIWLALHGAGVTDACQDIEGELLGRLRAMDGIGSDMPIFGAFDLHANFTEAMSRHATALVGYRENPHIDARDTAVRAAQLLARTLSGAPMPHMLSLRVPIIWPPTGTGTAVSPMRDLELRAREIETENPDIWAVNVIGGFSFSDVHDAGVAFSLVTTGDDTAAQAALDSLAEIAIRLRDKGQPAEWALDDALSEIKAKTDGPWIIIEPADNIGGGAAGDCTTVLRGLLRHGMKNAAVIIADPESVAALKDVSPGDTAQLKVGGKRTPQDPGPLDLTVTLIRKSDGNFDLEDRNSHMVASLGVHIKMGPCAVVETAGVTILLTSKKTAPADLGQLRSQGIIPESLSAIGVKGAVAHRRAYDPIAAGSYIVDTPGPCASDLSTLPYKNLRRPIHPLDPT